MADNKTLQDAFLDELRDTYDAEKQLLKALAKMAKAATSEELRSAFETHLEETNGQVDRLEQVFASLDQKARGKHCDGMAGIIEEGKSIMSEDFDEATMDACLVAGAQRAEHYEIAAYGTLVAWANALGLSDAAGLLEENLNEEKATDEALSALAEGGLNGAAVAGGEEGDDDVEDEADGGETEREMASAAPPASRASAGAKRASGGAGRGPAKAATR